MSTAPDLQTARRWFAEELHFAANVRSMAVVEAFATVPRERFVGPGPWRIRSPMDRAQYWTTEDADPRHVYHDVLIALDESRALNNGQPSLWALLLDHLNPLVGEHVLHLGCGTGYYSAILAELVGQQGAVTALEIDEKLAERARNALDAWCQVTVIAADGASYKPGLIDAIVASAGATHLLAVWLDSLNPGGRLLLPLTAEGRGGVVLLVTRHDADVFAARLICPVGFIEFVGVRDPEAQRQLKIALAQGDIDAVKSLRRDAHDTDATCWLHAEGWCLSRLNPVPPRDDDGTSSAGWDHGMPYHRTHTSPLGVGTGEHRTFLRTEAPDAHFAQLRGHWAMIAAGSIFCYSRGERRFRLRRLPQWLVSQWAALKGQ